MSEYTADDYLRAIEAAMKAGDMEAAASLMRGLAVRDPEAAQAILDAVDGKVSFRLAAPTESDQHDGLRSRADALNGATGLRMRSPVPPPQPGSGLGLVVAVQRRPLVRLPEIQERRMRTGPHYTARWTKGLDFFASTQVQWKQGPVKLGRVYNSSNPYPMWLLALHVGRFGVLWHWHPPARRRWPAAPPETKPPATESDPT